MSPRAFRRVIVAGLSVVSLLWLGLVQPAQAAAKQVCCKQGGNVTIALSSEVRSLDAAQMINALSSGGIQGNALYDVLIWVDPVTGKIHPGLAESFTSKDGVTWTMKLRSNLKFTDGTPLDAAAVKFSWDRLKDPALGSTARGAVSDWVSTTVVDPLTVQIVLQKQNYALPQLFGWYAMNWVVSPTAVAAQGTTFGSKPVGAGPFMLQSRTPGTSTVLVRNPNYWNKPYPYLDQITFTVNPDVQTLLNSVIAGQNQIGYVGSRYLAQQGVSGGVAATTQTYGGGARLDFNTTRPPFNDVRARQAVSFAINPEAINQSVYNGEDYAATNLFLPNSPFYDKSLKPPVNQPKQAQTLFDQLAAEKGGPLKFVITTINSSDNLASMQAIQTQLSSFKNVNATLDVLDAPGYINKLQVSRDFDSILNGTHFLDPEPQMYQGFHTGGSNNPGQFSDPVMDQALEQGRTASDPAGRKAAYKTAQQEFIKQVPGVFFRHLTWGVVRAKNIGGWIMYGQGNPLLDQVGYVTTSKK
jgi:peptide/nickel transport system substrate-binding protein